MTQPAAPSIVACAGVTSVLAWWIYDLQRHWVSMPEYHFGWIVLLLSAYVVWDRWSELPVHDTPAPIWICLTLVLFGAPFVLVAELYKQAVAHTPSSSASLSIGCALFLSALLLSIRGKATLKHFLFPLLFLFVAVPPPRIIWIPIVTGLQNLVSTLNVEVLNLAGVPAEQQGNVIRLANCVVGIDEACSGVRSLQSSIMAALFIGYILLRTWAGRLTFLGIGILLALLGNLARSVFLSITAHRQGIEALESVHDSAGWSILLFTSIGLALLAWWLTWIERVRYAGATVPITR